MSKRRASPQGKRAASTETVADYDVRSPAARTVMTVAGTVVAVVALSALVLGISLLMRETKVVTSQVDVGQNAQLVINATTADIEIVEGQPDLLTISSSVTSGLRETDYQVGRRDDEIKIVSTCQTWLNPGCGVRTRLEVPPGMPLVVRTTTGDVRADALPAGVLTVSTTVGTVTASDLNVDEFSADTEEGDVRATFMRQPFGFKASTTTGDVVATIPTGDLTYGVVAESEEGRVRSSVEHDDEGQGLIRVTSRDGDIEVRSSEPPDETG